MAAVDLTAGDDETAPRVHRFVPSTESPAGPVQLVDGLTMGRNQGSTVQIEGRSVEGTLKLSSKQRQQVRLVRSQQSPQSKRPLFFGLPGRELYFPWCGPRGFLFQRT